MTLQSSHDDVRLSVAYAPATSRQRRVALAFCAANLAAAVVIASIGLVPLSRIDGFIPAVQSVMAASDLTTAVLLFALHAAERSRALLVLAGAYLFTALIIAAQTLTFPGAFTPTGLLGAGQHTAAWLYFAWHVSLPAGALGYALLKPQAARSAETQIAASVAIRWTVLGCVLAAAALTAAVIAADDVLPALLVSETAFASTAGAVTVIALVVSVAAVVFVWRRRTSMLDDWLLVALTAFVAEAPIIILLGASRYTSAFYASRLLAFIASSAVLVALLSEMTGLYVRLSTAVRALQRERANKLMNLDVVVSSIAHEIKQPLMVITTCNTIIGNLLRKPKIDVADVQLNLDDVTKASVRIGETIDSLRGLFKDPKESHEHVDVNAIALDSLETLRAELSANDVVVTTDLTQGLPLVVGHRGQLREVLVNIIQNALDELAHLSDRARTLRIRTGYSPPSRVSVTVEDSGDGISPERLPDLFTAFITTKARGMGLGLSICQMIVERHNGALSVSSEIGMGTRFEVSLPAEAVPLAAELPSK